MARVLIVGYGNPLRGDDGLGWHAAGRLAQTLGDEETMVLALEQLTLDLVDHLVASDLVIFMDACRSEAPGELTIQAVEADSPPCGTFAHHLDPPGLLAYACQLYGKCPKGLLVTVSGENFGFGEKLSPAVEEMLPFLAERVEQAIAEFVLNRREDPASQGVRESLPMKSPTGP